MRNRILPAVAGLVFFVAISCQKTETPPFPAITTDYTKGLVVDCGSESEFGITQEMTIKSNRDWTVENNADWITVEPSSGVVDKVGQTQEFKVTVTVFTNEYGNTRNANIRFRTSAVYTDVAIRQKENPTAAPLTLYTNGFGKGAYKSDAQGGYPKMVNDDIWMVPDGATAVLDSVKYYGETASVDRLTIRSSSTSASSGYPGASGANHIHFGSGMPAFTLANVHVHEKLESIKILFGLLRNEFQSSSNIVNVKEFPMWISKDGLNWMQVEATPASNLAHDKWTLCEYAFSFKQASFDKLYVRFKPTLASVYRFDDLSVVNGKDTNAPEIDWTKATEVIDLADTANETQLNPKEKKAN